MKVLNLDVVFAFVSKLGFFYALSSILLTLFASPTQAVTYATSMSAVEWQVSGSVFECRLFHEVAGYGSGVFMRAAGEKEAFHLQQKQMLLPAGEAHISIAQPSWQVENHPRSLGRTTVIADKIPLRVDEVLAQQLRAALLNGNRVIIARAQGGDQNPVRVLMEPLRFGAAHQQYLDCFKKLLPVSFAEVSRTTLYFDDGSDNLPERERRKLDWLILYAKADKRAGHIFIDGHTDSSGPRPENLDISKVRAERIATSLTSAGLSSEKITTRWHGERYPVATNKSDQGRQKNRRVTIRLEFGP